MSPQANVQNNSPKKDISLVLGWLADAPLYINAELLESFYDAVIKPENRKGKTILEINKEDSQRVKTSAELEIDGELSAGDLLTKIANLFPSIKLRGKVSGGVEREGLDKKAEKNIVELFPIDNPQRQLVHLTLSYLFKNSDRLLLVEDPSQQEWLNTDSILASPRQLVFLDLPSQIQALAKGIPEVRLIPTAAEFFNGKVVPMFTEFQKENGERSPDYPKMNKKSASGEAIDTLEKLMLARREYWKWFDENYSSKKAMKIVEKAAAENGNLRWIDYRLPIANDGSTLHLHFSSAEKYSIGDFAYNLISRGMKHGLRIVGTLKSEPAINVLAVFEK